MEENRDQLRAIKTFPQLVKYLRDELDWPIETEDFEDLTFDYEPEELGIDPDTAAKIEEIKQLRPLVTNQPWGIFFAKFEPKRLPVVVLRRILSQLVLKKRVSSKKSEQPLWHLHDLLFISNYGENDQRQITFAHFTQDEKIGGLPTLRVLGWDDADTVLHIEYVHKELKEGLHWPDNEDDLDSWRQQWSSAFILRHREVITTSKELATRLAGLARRIRSRARVVLSVESQQGPLRRLHKAFQEALIHDLNEDDFADMYAQTITYGLFSAYLALSYCAIGNFTCSNSGVGNLTPGDLTIGNFGRGNLAVANISRLNRRYRHYLGVGHHRVDGPLGLAHVAPEPHVTSDNRCWVSGQG